MLWKRCYFSFFGEPDFNILILLKIRKEGMDQNYTKYMAVPGYEDLRESISKIFEDINLNYSKDQLLYQQV